MWTAALAELPTVAGFVARPLSGISSNIGGCMKSQKDDSLLTPAEVAALFRVDPKTVTRWAKAGKLSSIRTLGGHRRYRADEVRRFLDGAKQSGADADLSQPIG